MVSHFNAVLDSVAVCGDLPPIDRRFLMRAAILNTPFALGEEAKCRQSYCGLKRSD